MGAHFSKNSDVRGRNRDSLWMLLSSLLIKQVTASGKMGAPMQRDVADQFGYAGHNLAQDDDITQVFGQDTGSAFNSTGILGRGESPLGWRHVLALSAVLGACLGH